MKTIDQSCVNIQKILLNQRSSPTNEYCALGPALLASISLASNKEQTGSAVVLILDSLANWGMGAFYFDEKADQKISAQEFYKRVGALAFKEGVSINIFALQDGTDEDCNL